MQDFEFRSQDGKSLVATLAAPANPNEHTGAMLWMHGWGGNRFMYAPLLPEFAETFNLFVVSPEWRGAGYDADPATGKGISTPYDFSHLQVVDVLNAIQTVRLQHRVDDRRLFAWGGGQGGHIAVLLAAYAPKTFAMVANVAGFSYVDPGRLPLIGWEPQRLDYEIRDARRFAPKIQSKVWLIHGDQDESVPIEHAYSLERALRAAGVRTDARYYSGAKHMLDPITDRRQASLDCLSEDLRTLQTAGDTELKTGEVVRLECTGGAYCVNFGDHPITVRLETTSAKPASAASGRAGE